MIAITFLYCNQSLMIIWIRVEDIFESSTPMANALIRDSSPVDVVSPDFETVNRNCFRHKQQIYGVHQILSFQAGFKSPLKSILASRMDLS